MGFYQDHIVPYLQCIFDAPGASDRIPSARRSRGERTCSRDRHRLGDELAAVHATRDPRHRTRSFAEALSFARTSAREIGATVDYSKALQRRFDWRTKASTQSLLL